MFLFNNNILILFPTILYFLLKININIEIGKYININQYLKL